MKTVQEGMPLSRRLENKLRRIVKGPPDCVAIGMGNRCRDNLWHLFYDLDAVDARTFPWNYDCVHSYPTKHGQIVLNMECQPLSEVRRAFSSMQLWFPVGDYFWSVPLWLRISPKWYRTDGHVVSDSPGIPEELTRHFPMRKAYYTRD